MAELTPGTITIYRGEKVTIPFAFNPAEDITGQTLVFTVSKAVDKVTKLIGPLAVEVDDAATGECHVDLSEDDTDIKAGTYVYDVWRVDEDEEAIKGIGDFIIVGNARVPPVESA